MRGGFAAVCTALALVACGGKDEAGAAGRAEGVVESVDAAAKQVTIDHGEIPGMMSAMTMTFDVADPALLEGIEAGSRVDFRVKYENGSYVVTELREK
jgi:Cu/Ag efflux protein CusF